MPAALRYRGGRDDVQFVVSRQRAGPCPPFARLGAQVPPHVGRDQHERRPAIGGERRRGSGRGQSHARRMPRRPRVGNSALVSTESGRERAATPVKLLVLAQTPPPLHGQSVMVRAMLDALGGRPDFALHHVDFRLSRDNADIGRWRPGKIRQTIACAWRAVAEGRRHECDTLYYVPTPPGKRGALYRDWIVMAICRPFFRRIVLHWHAAGLGAWLETEAFGIERGMTRLLLGRADLAIVLSPSLRHDADYFRARRVAVVPNGVIDPGPPAKLIPGLGPCQALFLGLCCEEKGLFAAAAAIVAANERTGAPADHPRFTLVAAGPFPNEKEAARFRALTQAHPTMLRHVGFAGEPEKKILFVESRCLIFPTRYAAEALPLVVLEALAHDLPIVATRWRSLPDIVPPECGKLVAPGDGTALTDALIALHASPPQPGHCRDHFLRNFTLPHHLAALEAALRGGDRATATTSAETRA